MKLDTYSFDLYQSIVDRWEKAWVVNIGATFSAPTSKNKFLKFFQKKKESNKKDTLEKLPIFFQNKFLLFGINEDQV